MTITNVRTAGPVKTGTLFRLKPYCTVGPVAGMIGSITILGKPAARDEKIQIRKLKDTILFWYDSIMTVNTPTEFLNELKRNLEEPDTYLAN
jgi:hypothetical protein